MPLGKTHRYYIIPKSCWWILSRVATFLLLLSASRKQASALSIVSPNNHPSSSETNAAYENKQHALPLDWNKLEQTIRSGRVFQHHHFLSERQVQELLTELHRLEQANALSKSGLSDTSKKNQQGFGNRDRSVCAVPWWKDVLLLDAALLLDDDTTVASRIHNLRLTLATRLQRPSLVNAHLAHECYYSVSEIDSVLPRHMDERHEELKGAKGWLLPSRRSVSWLIYLSDADWTLDDNGGALRTFPQRVPWTTSPTHNGNLQVGYLQSSSSTTTPPRPVYLDSWYTVSGLPHNILYTVSSSDNNDGDKERLLTRPFSSDLLHGQSMADFVQSHCSQLFLDKQDAKQFALLEDRPLWDQGMMPAGSMVEDICPTRGSLVIFDSVLIPHQVERILQGRRVALAGWFHEATQAIPSLEI